jgi:hypothetical protein
VLGPPLFTVCIDNLETEIESRRLNVLVKKFADDTKGAKVIRGVEDYKRRRGRGKDAGSFRLTLRLGIQLGHCIQLQQMQGDACKKNP